MNIKSVYEKKIYFFNIKWIPRNLLLSWTVITNVYQSILEGKGSMLTKTKIEYTTWNFFFFFLLILEAKICNKFIFYFCWLQTIFYLVQTDFNLMIIISFQYLIHMIYLLNKKRIFYSK